MTFLAAREQEVVRLEVAMHESLRVRVRQPFEALLENGRAFASDSLPPWHASQSPTLPPSHNSMMK